MLRLSMVFALSLLLITSSVFADDFYLDDKRTVAKGDGQDFFSNGSLEQGAPQQLASAGVTYQPAELIKKLGFATGTGFFVSPKGFLVTNHHVVDGAKSVVIKMNDGALYNAEVLATDKANDIALLKVPGVTVEHPLSILKNSETDVGQEIMALGFPLVSLQGQNQKATFGRINSKYGIQDDVRFFQIDVPIQPGNSGGPILTRTGAVVGVATMTLSSVGTMKQTGTLPQNINYGVKIDYAMPMLDQYGVDYKLSSDNAPLEFTDVTKNASDAVVLVIATGDVEK